MSVRRRRLAVASLLAAVALGAGAAAPAMADTPAPASTSPVASPTPVTGPAAASDGAGQTTTDPAADPNPEPDDWTQQEIREQADVAAKEKADREAAQWAREEIREQAQVAAREKADRALRDAVRAAVAQRSPSQPGRARVALTSADRVRVEFLHADGSRTAVEAGQGFAQITPQTLHHRPQPEGIIVRDVRTHAVLARGAALFRPAADGHQQIDPAASPLPAGLTVNRVPGTNLTVLTWNDPA